jgi:F420-non-reducing hydrogenase iron-sulfur subunit
VEVATLPENGFEPRIVVFACNWCAYAGADLAGVSRIQYPPTTRIIRVMCSSRIDPTFVLKAFLHGADGVLVAGCHLGDCHYIEGNYNTEKRIKKTTQALEYLGFETKRLRLEWISASEGAKFAKVVAEFTSQIEELGPNLMRKTSEAIE